MGRKGLRPTMKDWHARSTRSAAHNRIPAAGLHTEYAMVIRAAVAKAGGVSQAATLLGTDPKTVRARERAAGVVLVVYRGVHHHEVHARGAAVRRDGRRQGKPGPTGRRPLWLHRRSRQVGVSPRRRLRRRRTRHPGPGSPGRGVARGRPRQGRPAPRTAAHLRRRGPPPAHASPGHREPQTDGTGQDPRAHRPVNAGATAAGRSSPDALRSCLAAVPPGRAAEDDVRTPEERTHHHDRIRSPLSPCPAAGRVRQ